MDRYGIDTQFDNFGQEHWDSACDNMPQEYVDAIVAMTMPEVKPPLTELNLIEIRLRERKQRETEEFLAEMRISHPELFGQKK